MLSLFDEYKQIPKIAKLHTETQQLSTTLKSQVFTELFQYVLSSIIPFIFYQAHSFLLSRRTSIFIRGLLLEFNSHFSFAYIFKRSFCIEYKRKTKSSCRRLCFRCDGTKVFFLNFFFEPDLKKCLFHLLSKIFQFGLANIFY